MKTRYFLMAAVLVGLSACSSGPDVKDTKVEAVTTTVDTAGPEERLQRDEVARTMMTEIEEWDERLSELKSRSLTTRSNDRFNQMDKSIAEMEKRMRDARKEFFEYRLATLENQPRYKKELNETLSEMRSLYNELPAD